MISGLLVPISSDPLKAGAAVMAPKHLRLNVQIFEGIRAVFMASDPKDVVGHE